MWLLLKYIQNFQLYSNIERIFAEFHLAQLRGKVQIRVVISGDTARPSAAKFCDISFCRNYAKLPKLGG
jgi:hypothetical protein